MLAFAFSLSVLCIFSLPHHQHFPRTFVVLAHVLYFSRNVLFLVVDRFDWNHIAQSLWLHNTFSFVNYPIKSHKMFQFTFIFEYIFFSTLGVFVCYPCAVCFFFSILYNPSSIRIFQSQPIFLMWNRFILLLILPARLFMYSDPIQICLCATVFSIRLFIFIFSLVRSIRFIWFTIEFLSDLARSYA